MVVVTEDTDGAPGDRVLATGRLPGYVKTTPAVQLYRSRRNLRMVRRLKLDPSVPLVFNNIVNAGGCAVGLPNPTIGFINDYNNFPSERHRYGLGSRLGKALLAALEKRAAERVDLVVVNSLYMRDLVRKYYAVDDSKIEVLYKGLAIDPDVPPVRPFEEGAPVRILFVKTDFKRGGLPTLLEALQQLPPTDRYELTVIGTTEENYRRQMGGYAMGSNVRIDWLGRCPPEIVQQKMEQTHIFCLPALSEALGVANMEAMMRNCRLITTGVGGIPEVTDRGRNCLEVPPGDAEAVARAILRLREEAPEQCWQRTARARAYVIEHFREEKAYARLLELIEKVRS